jgi:hypothetical protein
MARTNNMGIVKASSSSSLTKSYYINTTFDISFSIPFLAAFLDVWGKISLTALWYQRSNPIYETVHYSGVPRRKAWTAFGLRNATTRRSQAIGTRQVTGRQRLRFAQSASWTPLSIRTLNFCFLFPYPFPHSPPSERKILINPWPSCRQPDSQHLQHPKHHPPFPTSN